MNKQVQKILARATIVHGINTIEELVEIQALALKRLAENYQELDQAHCTAENFAMTYQTTQECVDDNIHKAKNGYR